MINIDRLNKSILKDIMKCKLNHKWRRTDFKEDGDNTYITLWNDYAAYVIEYEDLHINPFDIPLSNGIDKILHIDDHISAIEKNKLDFVGMIQKGNKWYYDFNDVKVDCKLLQCIRMFDGFYMTGPTPTSPVRIYDDDYTLRAIVMPTKM